MNTLDLNNKPLTPEEQANEVHIIKNFLRTTEYIETLLQNEPSFRIRLAQAAFAKKNELHGILGKALTEAQYKITMYKAKGVTPLPKEEEEPHGNLAFTASIEDLLANKGPDFKDKAHPVIQTLRANPEATLQLLQTDAELARKLALITLQRKSQRNQSLAALGAEIGNKLSSIQSKTPTTPAEGVTAIIANAIKNITNVQEAEPEPAEKIVPFSLITSELNGPDGQVLSYLQTEHPELLAAIETTLNRKIESLPQNADRSAILQALRTLNDELNQIPGATEAITKLQNDPTFTESIANRPYGHLNFDNLIINITLNNRLWLGIGFNPKTGTPVIHLIRRDS